jgi:ribosomal protein L11 methyltransferase
MRILGLLVPATDLDDVMAELAGRGTLGVHELPAPGNLIPIEAYFDSEWDASPLARYMPQWRSAPNVDWTRQWRADIEPLAVGNRLFLVPDWRDDPAPPGRLRLEVRFAQASGSGYHAPTQLALEALEQVLCPGDVFADIGTGSGILTRAARLLGAAQVVACDIDWEALQEARDLPVFCGSARALRSGFATCVAANLNAAALASLAGDLRRIVKPGGHLLLAGFRQHRTAAVRELFAWPAVALLTRAPWECLVLRHPQASK